MTREQALQALLLAANRAVWALESEGLQSYADELRIALATFQASEQPIVEVEAVEPEPFCEPKPCEKCGEHHLPEEPHK